MSIRMDFVLFNFFINLYLGYAVLHWKFFGHHISLCKWKSLIQENTWKLFLASVLYLCWIISISDRDTDSRSSASDNNTF